MSRPQLISGGDDDGARPGKRCLQAGVEAHVRLLRPEHMSDITPAGLVVQAEVECLDS
jgi:hypothetical protein